MDGSNQCGICLGEWTNPVKLPCGHSFCAGCLSGWKPKFGDEIGGLNDRQRRRCPLCRGTIPPSQEQIATMKLKKLVMEDKSDPLCETCSREVKQFEEEYGDDWEGNVIEYDNGFVNLPEYVIQAVFSGDFRTVLHWLGKGNVKERANAKYKEGGNFGLLYFAAVNRHYDLMSYLLLNGAAANMLNSTGTSMLAVACLGNEKMEAVPLLLSWGAEIFDEGKQITSQEKKLEWLVVNSDGRNAPIINPVSSELGGRRCEITSAPKPRDNLVGKTCVVDEYIKESDQYKVRMEFTNEVLLLGSDHLKRRDRTPQDPGYYVESKNNRLTRRNFKSNEECRAFIANLRADEDELIENDPDAGAKAEKAAADLLAELGLEDLEGPSSSASKKEEKPPENAGKKKKRGGKKKKGRK